MTGSTSKISIKRINVEQVGLVIELFNQYRVFYKKPGDMDLAKRFLTDRLTNNESVVFAAMNGDEPVGFTQLYPTFSSGRAEKNWILNDLYVSESHRKKGIGAMLIDAAMNFAKTDQARYVQLETAFDNYNAQHLYESVGFNRHLPGDDFFIYRKMLIKMPPTPLKGELMVQKI